MTADADASDDIDLIELFRAADRMGRLTAAADLTADDAGLIELGRVAHRVAKTGDAELTDPRLRAVWRELMRRNRKNGQFLHAAKFDVGCGTPDERQQSAISMLLTAACKPDMPNSRGSEWIRLFHAGMTDAPISTPV